MPIKEKKMANKKLWLGMLAVVFSILGLVFAGCASILPMSNEAISKYALASNPGNFKKFQYYVSRDIVLTYVSSVAQSTAVGQVSINRDIIQILSSTPGVVIEVKKSETGYTMLGVAFEASDTDLLWFVQNPAKAGTYFYLSYTNEEEKEINYGGNQYTVSYKQATGVGATITRLNPFSKVKKGEYDNMEPILLYEERVKESEQRRNLQGRKL
jgi:putative sterol carrier protein